MFKMMVLGYILDKGCDFIKSLTDQDVLDMKADLEAKEIEDGKQGRINIMTVEFQVELVNEARKVVNDDVYKFIKMMSKVIR
jgi:hypothetical protein